MTECETTSANHATRVVHVVTVPMTLKFFEGQPRFLSVHGYEVHMICSPGAPLDAFALAEGCRVHGVPMTREMTPLRDALSLIRLVMYLRNVRPTIVVAHTPKAGLLGMLAALVARTPVRIFEVHGLPSLAQRGVRAQIMAVAEWMTCAMAHRVLFVSRRLMHEAVRVGICVEAKASVVLSGSSNGIDAERKFVPQDKSVSDGVRARLGIPPTAIVLGFVGRIVIDKGIRELLSAWAVLRVQRPDLWLLVLGPLEGSLPRQLSDAVAADPRIRRVGYHDNVVPYYAAMDIVVLPSYREGLPNVPLEAAAMGLPVVATRITGTTEAVSDGVTGTLVPPRDANALVDAVRKYCEEPELRRVHGNAGRERMLSEFRQEPLWNGLLQEYETAIRRASVMR